jgi:hypothetical protein
VRRADLITFMCRMSRDAGRLNLLELSGPVRGLLYLFYLPVDTRNIPEDLNPQQDQIVLTQI